MFVGESEADGKGGFFDCFKKQCMIYFILGDCTLSTVLKK